MENLFFPTQNLFFPTLMHFCAKITYILSDSGNSFRCPGILSTASENGYFFAIYMVHSLPVFYKASNEGSKYQELGDM